MLNPALVTQDAEEEAGMEQQEVGSGVGPASEHPIPLAPVRQFTVQPGDGYRYTLIVVGPILGTTSCGVLGEVTNGFLVVLSNGSSYLFQDNHQPLGWNYIAEKFHLGYVSAKIVTRLLGSALDRPVVGCE